MIMRYSAEHYIAEAVGGVTHIHFLLDLAMHTAELPGLTTGRTFISLNLASTSRHGRVPKCHSAYILYTTACHGKGR